MLGLGFHGGDAACGGAGAFNAPPLVACLYVFVSMQSRQILPDGSLVAVLSCVLLSLQQSTAEQQSTAQPIVQLSSQ